METILPNPFENAFVGAAVGRRGSGKTRLVMDFIKSQYKNCFDLIVFVSPTYALQSDQKGKSFGNGKGVVVFKEWKPSIISSLYKYMEKQNTPVDGEEKKEKERCLLVLDDIGLLGLKGQLGDQLNQIAFISRNYQISVIECGQRMTVLSTGVRSQCDFIILFAEQNANERRNIFASFGIGEKKSFFKTIDEYTKEKYSWVGVKNDSGKLFLFNKDGKISSVDSRDRIKPGVSSPFDSSRKRL